MLLAEAQQEARRRGLRKLALNTFRELGNQEYWQRHAFTLIAEETMPKGTYGATAAFTVVHMKKELGE